MKNEEEKKGVYLDFEGVVKIFSDRGVKKNYNDISAETGFTRRGLEMLRKSAPKVVTMIHHFLKENDLRFEDLVKEIESKK